MTLKELRKSKMITQKTAADLCSVSLRSYKDYENDESKSNTIKYTYFKSRLEEYGIIDENHGIISVEYISDTCSDILKDHDVSFCYLFGSYAKGTATDTSDVDLLVSTSVTGIKYFGMVEKLRSALGKRIDILDMHQLDNNSELVYEILKEGIKIFDCNKK